MAAFSRYMAALEKISPSTDATAPKIRVVKK